MSYHHLAMAARDMTAIHDFYERITGFELVKVEIAPMMVTGMAMISGQGVAITSTDRKRSASPVTAHTMPDTIKANTANAPPS